MAWQTRRHWWSLAPHGRKIAAPRWSAPPHWVLAARQPGSWVQNLFHASSMKLRSFLSFFFGGGRGCGGCIVFHCLAQFNHLQANTSNPSIWYLIYLQLLACFGGLNWPEISRNARSQLVMHLEVSVFGGGRIILQCLVDVQNHFRPLLTKVVFKHSDVTHMCVCIYIYIKYIIFYYTGHHIGLIGF